MNLVNNFIVGAGVGAGFGSALNQEALAYDLYILFLNYTNIQAPPLAQEASSSGFGYTVAAGAGAIGGLIAPVLGTDRKIAASIATTAALLLDMSGDQKETLMPIALLGTGIVAIQTTFATGRFLYNGAAALTGRVRHLIGR